MVVARLGSRRAPLRSLPLVGQVTPFKKADRKPGVRRNLFGSAKDTEANLRVAQNLIASSAVSFTSRWGFDPVAEAPIKSDKFSWTLISGTTDGGAFSPFKKADDPRVKAAPVEEGTKLKKGTPQTSFPPKSPVGHTLAPMIQELKLQGSSPQKIKESPPSGEEQSPCRRNLVKPPQGRGLRQTKITEYTKTVKRRKSALRKL